MNDEYGDAMQLLSGFFHEDWDIAGETDADVIVYFKKQMSFSTQQKVVSDLKKILKLPDRDLVKIVDNLTSYGYEYFGLTARQWLERLIDLIE